MTTEEIRQKAMKRQTRYCKKCRVPLDRCPRCNRLYCPRCDEECCVWAFNDAIAEEEITQEEIDEIEKEKDRNCRNWWITRLG